MNVDAASGLFKMTEGPSGRPEIVVAPGIGVELGPLHGALTILAALLQRGRTGEGQYIDASMWDAGVAFNNAFRQALNFEPEDPARNSFSGAGRGARMNVYGTKDGKAIFIVPIERKFWSRFCTVLGHEEWIDRGTWDLPVDFGEEDPTLRDDIEQIMRTRTAEEWLEALMAADVPVTPVLTPDDLLTNAHVREREMVLPNSDAVYGNITFVRPPIRLPDSPFEITQPPPIFGEHTEVIMTELGYSEEALRQLVADGVVALGETEKQSL